VSVVASHLHHGLRPEADEEMARCCLFCEEYGIPFVSTHLDVQGYAQAHKIGIEEAGRILRYKLFDQLAREHGCTHIATAHTLSDHVETILFQITRGCGLGGLRGIPEVRGNIVRPIRIFTREETERYCKEHGLWYHQDPSNVDIKFARARIRHRVLSELREANPAVLQNIARLSKIASEEDEFLDGMAFLALLEAEVHVNGALEFIIRNKERIYDRKKLSSLPPVICKRALRLAAESLGGQMNYEQTCLLYGSLQDEEKGSVTLDGGDIAVVWDAGKLYYRFLEPPISYEYSLEVPGKVKDPDLVWTLEAKFVESSSCNRGEKGLGVMIDYAGCNGSLKVRNPKEGESLSDLRGRRKISTLLSRAGVTLALRKRLPIVCDQEGALWLPDLYLADRVKVTPETQRVVALELYAAPEKER
jgi:tRNA(Ile)-lysidine synthase